MEGRGRSDVVGRYVVEGGQLCFVWKQGIFELGRIDNECWKIYRYTEATPIYRNDYIGVRADTFVFPFAIME